MCYLLTKKNQLCESLTAVDTAAAAKVAEKELVVTTTFHVVAFGFKRNRHLTVPFFHYQKIKNEKKHFQFNQDDEG